MEVPVWASLWTTLLIIAGFLVFLVEGLEKTKKKQKSRDNREGGPEAGPDTALHSLSDPCFFWGGFLNGFAMLFLRPLCFLGFFGFPNGFAPFSENRTCTVLGPNTSD